MENNMNNTENNSEFYPQSQYSQSQYPQSSGPNTQFSAPNVSQYSYPMSEYYSKKKSKTGYVIAGIIAGVVILALVALLMLITRNSQLPSPPPMNGTMISLSKNSSMVNGQAVDFDYFNDDGKAYLNLEDISSSAGYTFTREGKQVKLLSEQELAIMEIGSTKVTLQDQMTKTTASVEILKAPVEKNGKIYIYARDLSVFLKNTSVSYNSMQETVEIMIGGGMMGQPPMQQGGQMPQGAPAQQGGQMPQGATQGQGGQPPQQGGQIPQN